MRPNLCRAVLFLLLLSQPAKAQEFRHYSGTNGLSGTDVTAICEDDNYLWIGTNEGLHRFDGKNFKLFRKDNLDPGSLKENNIETLMIDSRGRLWVGLKAGGVDVYDPRRDVFTHIGDMMEDPPQRVISLMEDSTGDIWLGTWGQGLYQLHLSDGEEAPYRMTRHYQTSIVSALLEYPRGRLWVGTYYGCFLYDIAGGHSVDLPDNHYPVTAFTALPEQDAVLFSTWGSGLRGLKRNPADGTYEELSFPVQVDNIYRILRSGKDIVLLGTWGEGIKRLSLADGSSEDLPLDNPVILDLYRDRRNRLWIGTYRNGLFCEMDEDTGLDGIPAGPLRGKAVSALLPLSESRLLVGTQGNGLFSFDAATGQFRRLTPEKVSVAFDLYILSLYRDEDILLVGDDSEGVLLAPAGTTDPGPGSFRRFAPEPRFGKVTAVFRGQDGRYWFGTKQEGLFSARYDGRARSFSNPLPSKAFGNDAITGFSDAGDSRLWVATYGGLYLYDTETDSAEKVPDERSSLIYSVADDRANRLLWAGSSDGLRNLDYSSGAPAMDVPDFAGLISGGPVTGLSLDGNGNVWFSAGGRVFVYSGTPRRLREISLGDLEGDSYHVSTWIPSASGDGLILFGGSSGLLSADPGKLLSHDESSRVLLSGLSIDNEDVRVGKSYQGTVILPESIEYVRDLTLPYQSRWIRFSFSELGPEVYYNSYQYRLLGLSGTWQAFDLSKPLAFPQLNPGSYTLQVRPASSAQADQDAPVWQLGIRVLAPWWKTLWFTLLIAALILLAAAGSTLLIVRHYRRLQARRIEELQKKQKEAVLAEKDNFLSGLSHDLLTSCTLILAPVKDLLRDENINDDQRERLGIISKNADFLANIFHTIRDYRFTEMGPGKPDLKRTDLVPFTGLAVSAFDFVAKSKDQTLSFVSDEESLWAMADTMKLERVLYNLISNAIKYTGNGGTVEVRLGRATGGDIVISVRDNGIGIADKDQLFQKYYRGEESAEQNGLGLGLYSTRRFMDMMGGSIDVDSEPGRGTTFTITLPFIPAEEDAAAGEDVPESDFLVLLVEDNAQMRDYLRGKFAKSFDVNVASDGREALDLIGRKLPELVVSDVMMPGMDGLELCRTIKASPLYSDIFVILLSAKTLPEDEAEGYRAGCDFYMKKPFDPDTLVRQIQNVYTTRQQRKKQITKQFYLPREEAGALSAEDAFLARACEIISNHLSDEDFSVADLSADMHVSQPVLYRKFKLLVNDSPNLFIRNMRLKKAAELLVTTDLSVAEIGYMTGFSQSHYFIKRFKEIYNETPKNYRINHRL